MFFGNPRRYKDASEQRPIINKIMHSEKCQTYDRKPKGILAPKIINAWNFKSKLVLTPLRVQPQPSQLKTKNPMNFTHCKMMINFHQAGAKFPKCTHFKGHNRNDKIAPIWQPVEQNLVICVVALVNPSYVGIIQSAIVTTYPRQSNVGRARTVLCAFESSLGLCFLLVR